MAKNYKNKAKKTNKTNNMVGSNQAKQECR